MPGDRSPERRRSVGALGSSGHGAGTAGDFIGLAEETGLIGPIGEFVLRQACWQACEWQRQGLAPIRVSVNLSVHQLRQGKLVSLVRQVLEETGLAPQYLELELTESQLLDSVEHIIATFQQLRDLGSSWPSTISAPATHP